MKPVRVFYSYSHEDERFRKVLEKNLTMLRRDGLISEWHDRKIIPGQDWEKEISNNLNHAEMVLLLVSKNFLYSNYCYANEMRWAMMAHKLGKATVVPIILSPVDWQTAPFAICQALPKDAKPITKWGNRDEAWTDVAKGIRRAVEHLQGDHLRRRLEAIEPGHSPEGNRQMAEVIAKETEPEILRLFSDALVSKIREMDSEPTTQYRLVEALEASRASDAVALLKNLLGGDVHPLVVFAINSALKTIK